MTKTILVVEDELPLLEAIARKLELNGFSVVTLEQLHKHSVS